MSELGQARCAGPPDRAGGGSASAGRSDTALLVIAECSSDWSSMSVKHERVRSQQWRRGRGSTQEQRGAIMSKDRRMTGKSIQLNARPGVGWPGAQGRRMSGSLYIRRDDSDSG